MERWRKRLRWMHAAGAWALAFMTISGGLLYAPALRGVLAGSRVALKQLHIGAGLFVAVLLAVYAFHLGKHWISLGRSRGRKWNTVVVLTLTLLWIGSGLVLWWERRLLAWAPTALVVHDVATWIGAPYLLGHAALRWAKVDLGLPWARTPSRHGPPAPLDPFEAYRKVQDIKRRRTLFVFGTSSGLLLAAGAGRWLLRPWLRSDSSAGAKAALAAPAPIPDRRSDPPVGGGARGRFRIYNVAFRFPSFDQQRWRLVVDGLVETPIALGWEEVVALPRDVWVRNFHCVSGWSVYDVTWEGIPLVHLMDMARPLSSASRVVFHSFDGVYTDALTIAQASLNDVFVALLKDGRPLTLEEGGPVRLVVSRMFAYKSVKWLERIELTDEPHIGFWERHGYDPDAWIPGAPKEGPLPNH